MTQRTDAGHPAHVVTANAQLDYEKDSKKGQTTGENVDAFGAEWYAVTPAGATVEPKTTSTPAPSSGGSGY